MSSGKVLTLDTINKQVKDMQYAVRGLVPTTAGKIAKEIEKTKDKHSSKYKFDEVLYCNIGNPQAVGQPHITFYRNVIALMDAPHLLKDPKINQLFPSDCVTRARHLLSHMKGGTGAYSHSQGVEIFRKTVAEFIEKRDGYPCNPEHLFLTNGASTGINLILTMLISAPDVGVLIPIPQYPIYSALIKLLNGTQLEYNLIEEQGWAIDMDGLKKTLKEAKEQGVKPRAMVIINPGNPTGSVLEYEQLAELVKLCKSEGLVLLADEVYQENIYTPGKKFHSVKKVVRDLGSDYDEFEFVSFHSTSKGLIGECGRRGGYMELCGLDPDVFAQLMKLVSAGLCSNLDGQVMTSLMCSPPKEGDASYELFIKERKLIFESLLFKSNMLYETFQNIEGLSCQKSDGAMYAFVKIDMPQGAIDAAKAEGQQADTFYALSLLNETGICCVPGSGFGQEKGTHHLRMTFLPETTKLKSAMKAFEKHHVEFMNKYGGKSNL